MQASGNLDGHLGEGTEVKGTLKFEGSVRIDGRFSGKIVSPATLILGPTARVDGELEVAKLAVHGTLQGKVVARDRITIHSSGKVQADLETGTLVIEPGAFYQGRCSMERPRSAPERTAAQAARKGSGASPNSGTKKTT